MSDDLYPSSGDFFHNGYGRIEHRLFKAQFHGSREHVHGQRFVLPGQHRQGRQGPVLGFDFAGLEINVNGGGLLGGSSTPAALMTTVSGDRSASIFLRRLTPSGARAMTTEGSSIPVYSMSVSERITSLTE